MQKIHLSDRGLFINAGMKFPKCYAKAELLDTDKGRLASSFIEKEVTCERCKNLIKREF